MAELPRYLVLAQSWLRPVGELNNVLMRAGSEVEFEGAPGGSMFPMNEAARASVIAYDRAHRATQWIRDRQRERGLAALTRSIAARVAPAIAAFTAAVSVAEAAETRR